MKTPNPNLTLVLGMILWTLPRVCLAQSARPISLVDPDFHVGSGPDRGVLSMALETDGRILIGGTFRTMGNSPRTGLARLKPDGALDPSFNPVIEHREGSQVAIRYITRQPDGRFLLVGLFTHVDGVLQRHLARLTQDGSLDRSFTAPVIPQPEPGAEAGLIAARFEADGKLLVRRSYGRFGTDGSVRHVFARLNADGSRDNTWTGSYVTLSVDRAGDPERRAILGATAPQSDGRVIIGGRFDSVQGIKRKDLARLNPDGSVDLTFEVAAGLEITNFDHASPREVTALALDSNGRILVGGGFDSIGGVKRREIARLNTDGSVDPTFNAGTASGSITVIAPQPDGTLFVGGGFSSFNGIARRSIVRLMANASVDPSFDSGRPPSMGTVTSIAVQPDGLLLIGGANSCCGRDDFGPGLFARFLPQNPTGTRFELEPAQYSFGVADHFTVFEGPSAGVEGPGTANFVVHRTGDDSKRASVEVITVAGTASANHDFEPVATSLVFEPGESAKAIAIALRDDDQPEADETFSILLQNPVNGSIQSGSGEIRVAVLDNDRPGSAVRHRPGGFENSQHNDTGLIVQPDGKVLVANAPDRTGLWRFKPDQTVDESFTPFKNFNIGAIALAPGGKIMVVDRSTDPVRIRRLNGNGLSDETFQPNVAVGYDAVLAVQPDGKVLVGHFGAMARLNSNGAVDSSFKVKLDGFITAISLQPDGRIIVGGWFSVVNGVKRDSLARLNTDGTLDGSFNAGPMSPLRGDLSTSIAAIALQPDGKLIVAGDFSEIGGITRKAIARLQVDGGVDGTFDAGKGPGNQLAFVDSSNPSPIQSLALQTDGKILVGGLFTSFNGTARNGITRLHPDGLLETAFDPGPIFIFREDRSQLTGGIRFLALMSNGNIAFAGAYGSGDGGVNCDANPFCQLNGDRKYVRLTATLTRPGGTLRLAASTQPGLRYTLESSPDLKTWLPLRTNTATGLTLEFEDTEAANFPRRFYRARLEL